MNDKTATGETLNSNQIIAGGSQKFLDGRANLRLDSEFNLNGNTTSASFPDRVRVGVDYRVNEKLSLFLDEEFAFGNRDHASTTRIGTKSKMWEGAESASSLNLRQTDAGPAISTSSTMTQTFKLTPTLTLNGGMDRTSTLKKPGSTSLNPKVPAAQGVNAGAGAASQSTLPPTGLAAATPVEDYTAVFAGTTWKDGPWGATARAEYRHGDTADKINVAGSVHHDFKSGQQLAAAALYSNTSSTPVGAAATHSKTMDLRLSYAFRPIDSLWIVLSRLDYIQEESDATGGQRSRRFVTNNNVNYQYNRSTQIAFQYGAKYVLDTFDNTSVKGFTDLYGAEVRHDFGNRFDLGVHASLMHSWQSRVMSSSYGLSVGFSPVTNMWLGLGYNFAGFKDRDFTSANATAKGMFVYLRMKADQDSLRGKDASTGTKRQTMFEEVRK